MGRLEMGICLRRQLDSPGWDGAVQPVPPWPLVALCRADEAAPRAGQDTSTHLDLAETLGASMAIDRRREPAGVAGGREDGNGRSSPDSS